MNSTVELSGKLIKLEQVASPALRNLLQKVAHSNPSQFESERRYKCYKDGKSWRQYRDCILLG